MTDAPNRLADYDLVLLNTSGGKDSQAMIDHVVELADAQGYDRAQIVAVHADLGRVEWEGTRELAEAQARAYGLRFEVVSRPQGDLLDHVEERDAKLRAKGDTTTPAWPSSTARYCTSDHKRGQVAKVVTALVAELRAAGIDRPRVLNCLGFRAEESAARAKRIPFAQDARLTNTRRDVDTWLPIFDYLEGDVWARIRASGVPHHRAYDLGMPRLSCVFCIFAPREALTIAAVHNRELGETYANLERRIGHTFRQDLSIAEVVEEAAEIRDAGEELETIRESLESAACSWTM